MYRILLGDESVGRRWIHRLPLRLGRSGSQAPLHIEIDVPFRYGPRKDNKDEQQDSKINSNSHTRGAELNDITTLLTLLSGKDGILCSRWHSLRLAVNSDFKLGYAALLPLTYPMSSLTTLHLKLRCDRHPGSERKELFPNLPSLESVILEGIFMHNYPDMSNAREISMRGGYCLSGIVPQHGLFNAPKLERLSLINDGFVFSFPPVYSDLRTLSVRGSLLTDGLLAVSMPLLEHLSVDFHSYSILEQIARLRDIGRIRTLHLIGGATTRSDPLRRSESQLVHSILQQCKGLNTLKVDEYVLSLLFEDWASYLEPTNPVLVFLAMNSGELMRISLDNPRSISELDRIKALH
ncbi:hypothetical protein FRC17_010699 [Serendipita sp. 399]|nr:hypothetical protein FRC17_010699 [Serendipita sp. 399]